MRIIISTIIIGMIAAPLSSKATNTREDIIAAATGEADTQYLSAPDYLGPDPLELVQI